MQFAMEFLIVAKVVANIHKNLDNVVERVRINPTKI
jgi:hypothetical protein